MAEAVVEHDVEQGVDVESIEYLDFEAPCTVLVQQFAIIFGIAVSTGASAPCARPAIAELHCLGCSARALVCGSHLDYIVGSPLVRCMSCHRGGVPKDVYEWHPLSNGATGG